MKRWKPFVAVGAIGFAIQIAALALLSSVFEWRAGPATAVAVELAVLNNFWWHGQWTWRDRPGASRRLIQLARFHLGTGCISLLGNVAGAVLLVEHFHLHVLAANALTVGLASRVNFIVADQWVFMRDGCAAD
jgi:putative flippase GtrA